MTTPVHARRLFLAAAPEERAQLARDLARDGIAPERIAALGPVPPAPPLPPRTGWRAELDRATAAPVDERAQLLVATGARFTDDRGFGADCVLDTAIALGEHGAAVELLRHLAHDADTVPRRWLDRVLEVVVRHPQVFGGSGPEDAEALGRYGLRSEFPARPVGAAILALCALGDVDRATALLTASGDDAQVDVVVDLRSVLRMQDLAGTRTASELRGLWDVALEGAIARDDHEALRALATLPRDHVALLLPRLVGLAEDHDDLELLCTVALAADEADADRLVSLAEDLARDWSSGSRLAVWLDRMRRTEAADAAWQRCVAQVPASRAGFLAQAAATVDRVQLARELISRVDDRARRAEARYSAVSELIGDGDVFVTDLLAEPPPVLAADVFTASALSRGSAQAWAFAAEHFEQVLDRRQVPSVRRALISAAMQAP